MYIFEINIKMIFDTSFDLFKEKKGVHPMEESLCTFYELKVQNARNHSMFCKTVFCKQVLAFHRPSKILCQTYKRQNHWSLMCP
jgi:hypothetical protein